MKPFALSDSEAHWYTLHECTAHRDGNKKRFHRAIIRRRLDQAADRLLEEAFKLAVQCHRQCRVLPFCNAVFHIWSRGGNDTSKWTLPADCHRNPFCSHEAEGRAARLVCHQQSLEARQAAKKDIQVLHDRLYDAHDSRGRFSGRHGKSMLVVSFHFKCFELGMYTFSTLLSSL